jgi:hypothetical protein
MYSNCIAHSHATRSAVCHVHRTLQFAITSFICKDRLPAAHSITTNVVPTEALLYHYYRINAFLFDKINTTTCLNLYWKLEVKFKMLVSKRHVLNFGGSMYSTGHRVSFLRILPLVLSIYSSWLISLFAFCIMKYTVRTAVSAVTRLPFLWLLVCRACCGLLVACYAVLATAEYDTHVHTQLQRFTT